MQIHDLVCSTTNNGNKQQRIPRNNLKFAPKIFQDYYVRLKDDIIAILKSLTYG